MSRFFHKMAWKRSDSYRMSIKMKLTLGLGAIAAMLLLSSVISVLEYRRMSNYLTDLIAGNVRNINAVHKFVALNDGYNLNLLTAIGDSSTVAFPEAEQKAFVERCDSLRLSIVLNTPLTDSVAASFAVFMDTSMELDKVIASDFIDSRDWYFNKLQPAYNRLMGDVERINDLIYDELTENSKSFQDGFYRSIIPGVVSVGAGLVLILLLLFFIIVYYLNPLYKMLSGIDNYRNSGQKYHYTFEGNDQLASLNDGITEIIEENIDLKRRNGSLMRWTRENKTEEDK